MKLLCCLCLCFLSLSGRTQTFAFKEGRTVTVTLDQYYNNEFRRNKAGQQERWHYIWDETDYGGYSVWAGIFRELGAKTDTLSTAPTAAALRGTDIYIIVDPDTRKETAQPHFMTSREAAVIYRWVKAGGVLVLLQNDSGNAEIAQFNTLTRRFGITFQENSIHRVKGNHYEEGAILIPGEHPVFPHVRKIYLKEVSTQLLQPPAQAILTDSGGVIMSVAKVGKGTVFAVGDPWLYNEYTDGRKLPAEYENAAAAADLSRWLISQVPEFKR